MSITLVVDTTLQATQQASDFSVLGFKSILPTSTNTPEVLTIDTFRDGVRPLLLSNPLAHLFAPGNAEKFLTNGTLTTDRATIGTRVNKTTKLVETLAIDTIREEAEGFLIEGAIPNLLIRSEEFDNAAWGRVQAGIGVAPVVTPNAGVAPDGSTTADRVFFDISIDDPANRSIIRQLILTTAETTYSIWLKSNTGVNQEIHLQTFGAPDLGVVVTTEWTRYESTNPTTGSNHWGLELRGENGSTAITSDLLVWGGQLEESPFKSSYIKTTTTAVTKSFDDDNITSANIPVPTSEYTIIADIDVIGLDSTKTQTVYNVDGETSRKIEINTTTGLVEATHGGVTSVSTTAVTPGTSVNVAFTIGSTNQTLYINGVQEAQSAKGTVTGTATGVSLGGAGGSDQLFGHEADFMIFERALNQLEIATLISGSELPATNSSEEDPLFPFVNTLDFRDNTKYSPLVTSGTVVIDFNQSVIQPIDYFAFAIHNSQDAGLTGKLEVDTGAGFETVAEFASVKNNRPFLKFFGTKNTQRQKLTLNFNSKLFIGTIFLGEAVVFNRTPSLNFQPGRTAPLDTVEQFTTDAGNNFIIGRRINRGFNEKSTFRFVKFDDIDLFYEDFQNHVLDSKSVFFKWSNTKNQTIFGLQNARTMTKPQYVTSFHADISFDISGYS